MIESYTKLLKRIADGIEEWGNDKKEKGLIPTADLFVEEIREELTKIKETN